LQKRYQQKIKNKTRHFTTVRGLSTTRKKNSDGSSVLSAGYIASTRKCEKVIYEVDILRNYIKNNNLLNYKIVHEQIAY
jgi:hypothetical protein